MMLQNRLLQGNAVAGAAPVPVAPHLSGRVAPITAAAASGAAAPSPVLAGAVRVCSCPVCCVQRCVLVGLSVHNTTLPSPQVPRAPLHHNTGRRVGDVAVAAAPSKTKDAEGERSVLG